MYFEKNEYYEEKFVKANLMGEIVDLVVFEDCEFEGCSFVECTFNKCSFINCKFKDCALSAVKTDDSRFTNVNFLKSKVIGLDWSKAELVDSISFDKCQISYSNFRLLKLPKVVIINCLSKDVDYSGADLSEANLSSTDFEASIFFKTSLYKANLTGAKNYLIDARKNVIDKAKFSLPEAMSLLTGLNIKIVD